MPKSVPEGRNEYVTSRGYGLPEGSSEFAEQFWFNMWQIRLWPYKKLGRGDILYWYDSKLETIVWKTRVTQVDRIDYENKQQVRVWLIGHFGDDPIDDPYFQDKPEHGYCLAFKTSPLQRLSVPKPDDSKFPRNGWLRLADDTAGAWRESLHVPEGHVGLAKELQQISDTLKDEGYFDARNIEDDRKKTLQEIAQRQGQSKFREELLSAYGKMCAVTGCDAEAALEAAHIMPYLGPKTNHVSNGLLLRADVHTLFDLDLIGIDPESLTVALSEGLRSTCYDEFQGKPLTLPKSKKSHPSEDALEERWEQFVGQDW